MTKDDPISGVLMDKFFDPVINAESEDTLRDWLRQQPADEIERFLNYFGGWSDFRDRESIVRQELSRKRRLERFEALGPDLVHADLAQGGYRYIGGTPEVRKLAQQWLREREGHHARPTKSAEDSPWMLRPNIYGVGVDLPKLWQKIKKGWCRR